MRRRSQHLVWPLVVVVLLSSASACSLDWKGKEKETQDAGDAINTRDDGGRGESNTGNVGGEDSGGRGNSDGGSAGDTGLGNTGDSTPDSTGSGTTGPGGACGSELCNGTDDDCDTTVDENCMAIDDCASLPCKNGGACTDGDRTFTCACPPGFEGPTCELNRDECTPNPCQNGGTCVDGVSNYTCTCTSKYAGPNCEYELCGDTTIRSKAEFVQNRLCREIRGKLTIDANGNLDSITSDDLPFLTQVTGDVVIAGLRPAAADQPWGSVTFPLLEKVGGTLAIGGVATPTQVKQISFPVLRSVGGVVGKNALDMLSVEVIAIDFPMLTAINGPVKLALLHELCSANLRNVTTVSGALSITDLPKLPTAHIQTLLVASPPMDGWVYDIGCCILRDGLDCSGTYDPSSAACQCKK